MKKIVRYSAVVAFALPLHLGALGLGNMKIYSFLDQPFNAEIELVDVGRLSLESIQIALADPQSFEHAGIEMTPELSELHFKVIRNRQGKVVIGIQSLERITTPYLELLVDLIWPKGQLFKSYTILLDPPGYVMNTGSTGPMFQSYPKVRSDKVTQELGKASINTAFSNNAGRDDKIRTYGPTLYNESIWQIAQRYKSETMLLPQIVLAIVDANPEAFLNGNLNGLKEGARLVIPTAQTIRQIPAELATEEVMAHDKAWNEKTPINHIITASDKNTANSKNQNALQSELPAIPLLIQKGSMVIEGIPHIMQATSVITQLPQVKQLPSNQTEAVAKAEIDITTAAMESIRQSNSLLTEQLSQLQKQNKQLQQQLSKRDKDMELIRLQLQTMMKERVGLASQAHASSSSNDGSLFWLLFIIMILVAAGGGGAIAWWYYNRRTQEKGEIANFNSPATDQTPFIPDIPILDIKNQEDTSFKDTKKTDESREVKKTEVKETKEPKKTKESYKKQDVPPEKPTSSNRIVEFESGLDQLIPKETKDNPVKTETNTPNTLDANSPPLELNNQLEKEQTSTTLKNKKAFDTLIALAKTYISMDDLESAQHSLEEVLEHGSPSQKKEAQSLLEKIKKK